MLPSVRTVRPEKPSVAAGDSYCMNDGEKRSPETWARSKPPVTFTDNACLSLFSADQVPLMFPIWRNVSSFSRRNWKVSNGFETVEPPPLNGLRTKVPVASVESRFRTPGVYAKQ